MPIDGNTFAVKAAVLCFFGIGCLGWFCQLSPLTCTIRSVCAAGFVYVASRITVNLINRILIDALIKSRMKQHEEHTSERQA
jgi:hypothetical protein